MKMTNKTGGVFNPIIVAMRGRNPQNTSDRPVGAPTEQRLEPNTEGVSNTLTSVSKDNLVLIAANTHKGFEEVQPGDSINFSQPSSKTRRGRVGKGVAQTLDTACNQGVIQLNPSTESGGKQPYQQNRVYAEQGLIPALSQLSDRYNTMTGARIRRLTETEVERLQGLPDGWTKYGIYDERPNRKDLLHREMQPEMWAYFTKMVEEGNVTLREISSTQRYRLCGNGVTKDIIEMLGLKLIETNYPEFRHKEQNVQVSDTTGA